MKRIGKILLVTLLLIVGVLLAGTIVLAVKSPGRLDPLKDTEGKVIVGSLTEKNFIEIGGMRQGFFIRTENPENPVLLYLHGGPGSPELAYSVAYELSERLEKYFTVCYWEQRGAGMSFNNSIDDATMNVKQFVEDARQMTEYLQSRFKKDKIFLMGHSWGSYLGIKIIEKYPENYLAYIGIGQISNQLESEKLAYDYLLNLSALKADSKTYEKLKQFDSQAPDFPSEDYLMTSRGLLNESGVGIAHQNLTMSTLIKNMLLFEGYTLSEKINYGKGSLFSLKLFDNAMNDNLFESSVSFNVPLFFVQGKYDFVTSYTLARDYLDKIEAPQKAFFTFDNAAHAPNLEEPDKFMQTVRQILQMTEGNDND
jgi:pimeloyl-ACP methyl ester carboxylesterase